MSEDIRKMIDKVKNFKQFVNENSDGDLYYHGSCKDFNRFENIGNNASTTMFGNKLSVQGNFLTKNRRFAELFAKTNDGCFIYSIKVLRNHILDLTNVEHLKNFMQYVGMEEYEEFKEEEYIVDGLPTWDLYPAIEFAKKNSFDGIKLLEFSADISNEPIESILIFDPSNLKIIKKEKT
jgi:hypothetical protein